MNDRKDWVNELDDLRLRYPNAEIVVMVSDEANNGDYSMMSCDNINVNYQQSVIWNGQYTDDDEWIKQELADNISDCADLKKETQKEFDKFIKENPWMDIIFINIG